MSGCAQTVGPVNFDYLWFQSRYPELARWVSPEMGQMYFDIATLYLDNSDGAAPTYIDGCGCVGSRAIGGPISDIGRRQIFLGLLTAHIAALNAPLNGQASSALIGRISSATEGSVSIGVEYPHVAGAEWFQLSKYGVAFWQLTAGLRTARYLPGPQPRRGLYGWQF